MSIDDEVVERYLEAARTGDHPTASALVLELLHDGVPADAIVERLLVAAQLRTGERWWRNEWTVADEHLVSTTTAAAVEALSSASGAQPGPGHLVVVCAEGDWHGLPGRLFSERMRARGWRVTFLGASTPADHVAEFLGRGGYGALAVTCALPLTFAGAARLADVGHEAGLPVLIGGAGITPNPRRALELGADAPATSAEEADSVLRDLVGTPVVRPSTPLRWTAFSLEAAADDLSRAAFDDLERAFPAMASYDERQRDRTLEDLVYIVRHLAAAVLVNDAAVWWDFAEWQRALLTARRVPEQAFDAAVAVLRSHLDETYPQVAQLLSTDSRPPP